MTVTLAPQLLVETFSIDPTRLDESDGCWKKKLPDGRWRVRCVGQHCWMGEDSGLKRNRNNRRYPGRTTWGPHLQEGSPFQRRIAARRVIGQVEHPTDGRSSLGAAAIVITKAEPPHPDGRVFVEWETLATPGGKVIAGLLESNVGFGMSSRGNGSCMRADDGVDEVQGDFEPVTWDCVADESTPGAEVAATTIRESLEKMVADAGGDLNEAVRRDRELAESAISKLERCLSEGGEPSACCTRAVQEGAGTVGRARRQDHGAVLTRQGDRVYRAFEDGLGRLDVWEGVNLVAESVADITAARQAAMAHLQEMDAPPPGGEWILGTEDGLGHYRRYELAPSDWAVWFFPHAGEPVKVACGLRTQRDALDRAEEHMRMLGHGGDKYAGDANEAFQPVDVVSFEGTCIRLRFDTDDESKKGTSALEKAGFHVENLGDTGVEVQTAYGDPEAALAHIGRVLRGADIDLASMQEGGFPAAVPTAGVRGPGGGPPTGYMDDYGWGDDEDDEYLLGDEEYEMGDYAYMGRASLPAGMDDPMMDDPMMRDAHMYMDDPPEDDGEDPHAAALARKPGDEEGGEEEPNAAALARKNGEMDEPMMRDYMGDYPMDDPDGYMGCPSAEEEEEAFMREASMGVNAPAKPNDREGPDFVGDPEVGEEPTDDEEDAMDPYTGEYRGTDPEDLDLDLSVHERRGRRLPPRRRRPTREAYEVGDTKRHGKDPAAVKTSGQGGADVKAAQTPKTHAGAPAKTVSTGSPDGGGDMSGPEAGAGLAGEYRDDQRKPKEGGSDLPDKGKGGRGGRSEPQKPAKMAEAVIERALPDLRRAWARGDGRRAARISRFIERACRTMLQGLHEGHPSRRTRFLQNEVARLEDENSRLRQLTEAMAEVQRMEVLGYERKLLLREHPELEAVAERLERCDTVDELQEEARAFLKVMGKAPARPVQEASKKAREFISKEIEHLIKDKGYEQDRAVAAAYSQARDKGYDVPANESVEMKNIVQEVLERVQSRAGDDDGQKAGGAQFSFLRESNGGQGPESVSSAQVPGAPAKPLTGSTVVPGGTLAEGAGMGDTVSRLVKYRRRRRGGR